ncbi:MAG: glycosyltransferase [Pseudomonadota bacterium]
MIHFALVAPPFLSHLRALDALAGQLMVRGHRVTWLQQADVGSLMDFGRAGFVALGEGTHPPGSLGAVIARAARPGGPLGIARVIRDMARATEMLCREAPAALRELGCNAVIADQMEAAGALAAEAAGLPFVSVACALPLNREPRVPLPVMPWRYALDAQAEKLNETSARVHDWLLRPLCEVIEFHSRAMGLAPKRTLADCLSPLAQLSQTVAAFDFPRQHLPPHFHHVGPLRAPMTAEPALDLPGDDGRPVVFASLGTLQGGRFRLFERIARACRTVGAQVLVAHCDRLMPAQEKSLRRAGATWVTGFAPQRAAIRRADVVLTHGGLNTVLDAFAAGKPVLALPIAFDQPGVAARVAHLGAGLRVPASMATSRAIGTALRRLLTEPAFKTRASDLGIAVAAAGGVELAADITEAAVLLGRPVLTRPPVAPASLTSTEYSPHVEPEFRPA